MDRTINLKQKIGKAVDTWENFHQPSALQLVHVTFQKELQQCNHPSLQDSLKGVMKMMTPTHSFVKGVQEKLAWSDNAVFGMDYLGFHLSLSSHGWIIIGQSESLLFDRRICGLCCSFALIFEGVPTLDDASEEEIAAHHNHEINMQSLCQNAFQITMFCLDEEFDHRALDFLAAAFVFEGKDYCIVQLPYNCPTPDFVQYFTCIPRTDWTGETDDDHDVLLYVLHQKSLTNGFEVRLAVPQDMGNIQDLLRGFKNCIDISPWVERPTKGCMAWLASCRAEVVGVAFVDTSCPTNALNSHFDLRKLMNIDQHQESCRAVLTMFFLNSLFANRQRLFLREIMRQMTKTVLFLPVFQGQNVSNMLEDMVLVPGRWHSSMSPPCTWTQGPLQSSPNMHSSFRGSIQQHATNTTTGKYVGFDCALFAMTHRLLSRKRNLVNSRIVVVGASQSAAACLNKLITCTNLKFSNITLISPFGLKSFCDSDKALLDVELGPTNAFQKLGIDSLVKIVTDTVIDFDKRAKCIQLMSGKKLQYDYLILTVGLQDQTRAKLQVDSNKGVIDFNEVSIIMNENTSNVFKLDLPIVIYGLSLQTFCSIYLLLSKGVPGSSLVVVYPEFEPLDSFAERCFQDGFIVAALMKEIRAAGVIERSGFKLLEVIPGEKESFLQAVGLEKIFRASLSSQNESNNNGICIKQPCKLLVTCTQPHVNQNLFRAIRKVQGTWTCKNSKLLQWLHEVKLLMKDFQAIQIQRISRQHNKEADNMANTQFEVMVGAIKFKEPFF
ncbi:hypothetical protein L7F22_057305 [Adiantum nelumboides]|nr:hypothetical protein [Adiantum nelumboides]